MKINEISYPVRQVIKTIVSFLMLLAIMFGVGVYSYVQNDEVKIDTWETIKECKITYGDNSEKDLSLPEFIPKSDKFTLAIDVSKYKDDRNSCVAMFISYCSVSAYADGKLIYNREPVKTSLSPSGASEVIIFDIPNDMKDKDIIIELTPLLEFMKYTKIPVISIGNRADLVIDSMMFDFPIMLISVILILAFVAICSWIIYRGIIFKDHEYTMIYISIVGIIVTNYFLTQIWTFNYMLSRINVLVYFLEYTALMVSPIPAIVLVKNKFTPKMQKINSLFINVCILNVIVQYVFIFTGIAEFRQFLAFDHVVLLLAAAFMIISYIRTDEKLNPHKRDLAFFVFVLSLSFCMPALYYIIYANIILQNAVMILILVAVAGEIKRLLETYKTIETDNIKNREFEEMALIDSLTKLPNRRSYKQFSKQIVESHISGWILSIDLNDLKYINDTFGHHVGDEMIQTFADIAKKEVLRNQNVRAFRIGGDEFLIFIETDSNKDVEFFVQNINDRFKFRLKSDESFVSTVAIGYSYYDGKSEDIEEVYIQADKNMYTSKNIYKQKQASRKVD